MGEFGVGGVLVEGGTVATPWINLITELSLLLPNETVALIVLSVEVTVWLVKLLLRFPKLLLLIEVAGAKRLLVSIICAI